MKGKVVPALLLTLALMAFYLIAFVTEAGALQLPAIEDPDPHVPEPTRESSIVTSEINAETASAAAAWTPLAVAQDPLLRLPGTQPDQGVALDGPGQCANCHAGFDPLTEPYLWQGSMMAHSARDFLYWPTVTVAAQDSIWALGNPNATDFCLRCHMPGGWLGGRSDPTNGSAMNGIDYDGVQCNLCHYLYDPFFETTYDGTREGSDWLGYWDETNASRTPSDAAALELYNQDSSLAAAITNFNGSAFYSGNLPPAGFTENGSGEMFVSTLSNNRRASFADANASHNLYYSRYHKSKYFCSTCHDISNPVLANLGADETQPLPTETDPAYSYYHVERTFSEFMLSDFGMQGGAAGIGPYDPAVFETSQPGNVIATCQDCHMPDQIGRAAAQSKAITRPAGSDEHPKSGVPQHDLTGGNMWVSYVLASAVPGSANYDATNDALLNQGLAILTMDLTSGEAFDAPSLLAGVGRAEQNLHDAAAIENVGYDPVSGDLSLRIQNQTGHKLISGYPEGRRMFLNIRYYAGETLLQEVNPYDATAGTLKGLSGFDYDDPDGILLDPAPLAANEQYVDALVYEMHGSSSITGEDETFHFALSDGRYKDNRIPPMGFRINEASDRLSEPVWHGVSDLDYYSAEEYAGGYDEIELDDYGLVVTGADRVEITLYYQTTSREYIEFLRNEINGDATPTLIGDGISGDPAYLIQTDPFFTQLKAWGDTVWQLWRHNMDLPGAAPVAMVTSTFTTTVNHPPVAVSDSYTTTVNNTLELLAPGVLGNDSDSDQDPLSAMLDSSVSHGDLDLAADGSFVYTPTTDFNGTDGFTYHANDGLQDSNTVAVTLTVSLINRVPLAAVDSFTTTEDVVLVVGAPGVLGNDSDPDQDPLSAVLDSSVSHGSLDLLSDGSFVYTPTHNFNGLDSFSYHANDGSLDSATVLVTLTVTATNDPPIAAADSYTTAEDVALVVGAPGVLGNDSDPDQDSLQAVLDNSVGHGSLGLLSDGSFVYTPTHNFNGLDSFSYHANDGSLDSATAVVTLTVSAANDPPIAANDSYTTTEDVVLVVGAPGVLGNDSDPDGDPLQAVLESTVSHGSLGLLSDGSFVYTPTHNFNGLDSFSYHANDGSLDSATAVVTLTVSAVNDPPIAAADSYTTTQNSPLVVLAPGVLGNDSDVDGDDLGAIIGDEPVSGTLALQADGSFVYTPTTNFSGLDAFTYYADDGRALSDLATVTIVVREVNEAPVAAADLYTVTEDIPRVVPAPGVLANDHDPDGNPLVAILEEDPAAGSLDLAINGGFVYTPELNFTGVVTFMYHIHDGLLDSNTAVVTLTVTPVNDQPIVSSDAYTTSEDITLAVAAPGVLGNDEDVDGDGLTAVLGNDVAHGDLALAADGSFVYTPTLNFHGQDGFSYRANDGQLYSGLITVTLTITAVNDAPVASGDSYTATAGVALVMAAPGVLGNDDDVDGDSLAAVLVTDVAHGQLALQPDGSFIYTPKEGYSGPDSFSYRASDGKLNSSVVSVLITVEAPLEFELFLPVLLKQ